MFTASLSIFLFGLVAAAAGGYVGAAIGGNFAFVITGFCVIFAWGIMVTPAANAVDPGIALNYIAFGPFAGPHIVFAGGAAAAAYAAHKGYIESGKEITGPLARLGRTDVLFVGSIFGVFGYLWQIGISQIPWFGTHTDSVALTVVCSAIIARLAFGNSAIGKASLFNTEKLLAKKNDKDSFMGRWDIDPTSDEKNPNIWLDWQARPRQFLPVSFMWGMFGAGVALMLAINFPTMAGAASSFPFAISAIIILFLCCGFNTQVQHHITIIGGLGAVVFLPVLAGHAGTIVDYYTKAGITTGANFWYLALAALIIGGIWGVFSGTFAEVWARVWYNRGTTHIDPPASTIWMSTTAIWLVAHFFDVIG